MGMASDMFSSSSFLEVVLLPILFTHLLPSIKQTTKTKWKKKAAIERVFD